MLAPEGTAFTSNSLGFAKQSTLHCERINVKCGVRIQFLCRFSKQTNCLTFCCISTYEYIFLPTVNMVYDD